MSALENHPKTNAAIKSINAGLKLFSTLAKQNGDCMTEKLNILKGSLGPVMHLLSQITSRQLVTT